MGTSHEVHDTADQIDVELSSELRGRVVGLSTLLTTQFSQELQDPKAIQKVCRLLRTLLLPTRPRCGRPQATPITAAIDLANKGVPRAQIPWRVIPGFGKMSLRDQSLAREKLRRGIYMRRKRDNATKAKRSL